MDIEPETGMSELLAALDEPAAETAEPEAEQATDDQQPAATEEKAEEQPQEETPEIVDLDGKKLEIPPGTPPQLVETVKKMAADLKADHTRKTQATAEAQKQIVEAAQALAHHKQMLGATADTYAELVQAQKTLKAYEEFDLASISDPERKADIVSQHLKAQALVASKHSAWQQALNQFQQSEATQREQAAATKWSTAAEQARQALGSGFSEKANQAASKWLASRVQEQDRVAIATRFGDPVVLEAIFKAAQFDALQAGKPMQKAAPTARAIKPAAVPDKRENQSALERLKKTGRATELINFL